MTGLSNEWRLTDKGISMLSDEIMLEINTISAKRSRLTSILSKFKRANPGNTNSLGVIKALGGVSRLAIEADRLDIPISELIVMIDSYISNHPLSSEGE